MWNATHNMVQLQAVTSLEKLGGEGGTLVTPQHVIIKKEYLILDVLITFFGEKLRGTALVEATALDGESNPLYCPRHMTYAVARDSAV